MRPPPLKEAGVGMLMRTDERPVARAVLGKVNVVVTMSGTPQHCNAQADRVSTTFWEELSVGKVETGRLKPLLIFSPRRLHTPKI